MLKNYFISALRNIFRNRLFSCLNILGLAIGIVSCLFIYMYIMDELSFDKHHAKAARIYRIQTFFKFEDVEDKFGISSFPIVPTLQKDFPEVEDGTRLFTLNKQNFTYNNEVINQEDVYLADSNFFQVFDFNFILGSPKRALAEPNSIVLTSAAARKIFGSEEDPYGKMLTWNNKTLKVTGLIDETKYNTHIPLGAFITMSSMNPQFYTNLMNNWGNNNSYSYILLKGPGIGEAFKTKLDQLVSKYVMPQWKSSGFNGSINMYAEPLKDIHFNNYLIYDTPKKGNKTYVYIFSVVAVLILVIACINYMNLSTAAATRRAKEVGIRKTVGASNTNLIGQFIGESMLISFISALLALVLFELMLPAFNNITGKNLSESVLLSGDFLLVLVGLIIFIGLVAGSYPAFYLSRFSPQAIFKNSAARGGNVLLRKTLVTGQFAISVIMVIATIVIFLQLHFMKTKDLGFAKDNMMVITVPPGDSTNVSRLKSLKNELTALSEVKNVARTAHIPGGNVSRFVVKLNTKNGEEQKPVATMFVDQDFPAMMKMKLVKGRFFSRDIPSDAENAMVVNEATVNSFGWKDPLLEKFTIPGEGGQPDQEIRVIGVVKDFHVASLHTPIEPVSMVLTHPKATGGLLLVELNGTTTAGVEAVKRKWQEIMPNKVFEYQFLDDNLQKLYVAEDKMMRVFLYFAFLTILISSMGLFGLSSFTTQQRTKEIGIRKVMGASTPDIVMLINKDFLKLIFISVVISFPVAWYALRQWQESFAYKASIGYWVFFAAAVFALVTCIITVSFHALRTANSNPVRSLRYE